MSGVGKKEESGEEKINVPYVHGDKRTWRCGRKLISVFFAGGKDARRGDQSPERSKLTDCCEGRET